MIQLHQILVVFFILTVFLPLSFLSKKLSYFRFNFFVQITVLTFIYFLLSIDIDIYSNIIWWILIVMFLIYTQSRLNSWEWLFLIAFILISLYLFLIGFITNFLGLFILLEAQVIVFIILTQLENNSIINIEAIARWCLLNIVSSLFLIMSFGILYQSFGTINLVDIILLDASLDGYSKFGFVLFYSSFLFKIGIPPFHFWLPDVYETNNLQVVSILIGPIKLFYIIVLQYFVIIQEEISILFLTIGTLSVVIGLLIALNQVNIKKFLAWTGIFYFGIFLLLITNITVENIFYLKVYINIYLFSSLTFLLLNQINTFKLSDFMLLFGDNFLIGMYFLAVLIIIMGLPVIAGFFSKLVFFYTLISSNVNYLLILFLLMLTSFAGFYYLNTFIFGLSYKYLLHNNNLLESINIKFNVFIYFIVILTLLIMFFPYHLSTIILYFV